jgi:acyl carrier protein
MPLADKEIALEEEIKALIIRTLELEDITVSDIISQDPLFDEGLGLDSIDALEIGLMLQENYGVVIDAEDEATRTHFSSVANLASFIESQRDAA